MKPKSDAILNQKVDTNRIICDFHLTCYQIQQLVQTQLPTKGIENISIAL